MKLSSSHKVSWLVAFFSCCVFAKAEAQTLSESIVFEERVFNFGSIAEEKGKLTHVFRFQNKGKTAVTITKVNTGCGCMVEKSAQKPIPPGGTGEVVITLDPAYKSGFFSKEIVVLSEDGQKFNRIWMEGNIQPGKHPVEDEYPYNFGAGLHFRLKVLAFGYVGSGEKKGMTLHFANESGKEIDLRFEADESTKGLFWQQPGKVKAGGRGQLDFVFRMPDFSTDDVSYTLYPVVNGKRINETITVKILNAAKIK